MAKQYSPDTQHKAWLSLGSNLGDRIGNLEKATELIEERMGGILVRSGLYESEAWGFESSNAFLNCCLELHTFLEPAELMAAILRLEEELGRKRSPGGYIDRLIDIDILLYDLEVIDQENLVLPHPRMKERGFVLRPLAEIASSMVHPVLGLTISEMMEACPDKSRIRRL